MEGKKQGRKVKPAVKGQWKLIKPELVPQAPTPADYTFVQLKIFYFYI
jgi:hypothetical protein